MTNAMEGQVVAVDMKIYTRTADMVNSIMLAASPATFSPTHTKPTQNGR